MNAMTSSTMPSAPASDSVGAPANRATNPLVQQEQRLALSKVLARHGLSVVLPAYDEEAAIGGTLAAVVGQLDAWDADFEVIVVNDGSRDRTGAVVEEMIRRDPRVRQIVHAVNQGYGGALASGFAVATKDLTFFMDSDGQFAIDDLARLLVWIDEVDAVLGYRIARQDTRMRRFNAWCWKVLVRLVLGVRVRDLDCAFKLLRTDFLHTDPPETRSALINAELLYKLTRCGATYREVGVTHLPRRGGQATGAHPRVIARALRDLLLSASRWRRARPASLAKRSSIIQANESGFSDTHAVVPVSIGNPHEQAGRRIEASSSSSKGGSVMMIPDGYLVIDEANPGAMQTGSSVLPPRTTLPPTPSSGSSAPSLSSLFAPHRLALAAVTLLSIILNFYQLGQNGFGNLYYAAAVRSMGSNWHAFFFNSLDPAGFVSLDKPPLGFWFQVLSTKILGFTPFAIFLPQALAGVLSVVLVYWLVRRHFGPVAGLIAALALAVSPISVVTNRNNTIDSTLMLALLLGAWAVLRAIETDQLRYLVLAGAFVALGFNIKMLEAYLVVPAFFLAYVLGSRKPWARRLGSLLVAGVTMLGLSLVWLVIVDLVPTALRPWVGSTTDNSELSLAFGYNGLQRLTGGGGPGGNGGAPGGDPGGAPGLGPGGRGPGGGFPGAPGGQGSLGGGATSSAIAQARASGSAGTAAYGPPESFAGGPGGQGGPGGGTGMFNTGNPGLLRLFTPPLGGQIVWLLPLALIGLVALALDRPFRPREDRQQQSMVLWGTWLLTMAVFFSVASFFHQYYLSQMAPAIAALVGIGVVVMWRRFVQPGWRGWFLPLALGATALEQLYLVSVDPSWGTWLLPLLGVTVALTLVLAFIRLLPQLSLKRSLGLAAVALISAGLLAAPTVWSAYPAWANTAPDLPIAGIENGGGAGGPGGGASGVAVNSALISYLEAHQGAATYLVAVPTSSESAPIIIATGDAVMTLGGFNGSDPILTTAQLQSLIGLGTVRYFLLSGAGNGRGGGAGGPGQATSSVTSWVEQNCAAVSSSAWQSGASGSTGIADPSGNAQLYDCAARG